MCTVSGRRGRAGKVPHTVKHIYSKYSDPGANIVRNRDVLITPHFAEGSQVRLRSHRAFM